MCLGANIYIFISLSSSLSLSLSRSIYIHIYIYLYTYIYKYLYTYIHTSSIFSRSVAHTNAPPVVSVLKGAKGASAALEKNSSWRLYLSIFTCISLFLSLSLSLSLSLYIYIYIYTYTYIHVRIKGVVLSLSLSLSIDIHTYAYIHIYICFTPPYTSMRTSSFVSGSVAHINAPPVVSVLNGAKGASAALEKKSSWRSFHASVSTVKGTQPYRQGGAKISALTNK